MSIKVELELLLKVDTDVLEDQSNLKFPTESLFTLIFFFSFFNNFSGLFVRVSFVCSYANSERPYNLESLG